ncbi:MAG: type II toxin-antitoxin system VapC family toxin [Lachnospiraceae bacterium]|nr:type II toxin-antitoxin system VapC family toxin [Lachnospiraceae bacterium]
MYLIDTHVLIWSLFDAGKLSDQAEHIITNSNMIYVSIASLWEIAIKQSIGKIEIQSTLQEIADQCSKSQIDVLNILPVHLDVIKQLPRIHNDPFDRLIIAQAVTEGLTLITKDTYIPQYDIKTIW